MKLFSKRTRSQKGASTTEYALVAACFAMFCMPVLHNLGTNSAHTFYEVDAAFNPAVTSMEGAGPWWGDPGYDMNTEGGGTTTSAGGEAEEEGEDDLTNWQDDTGGHN